MKILKRGKPPKEKEHKGKCDNCGTVVLCKRKEIKQEEDRGQDYHYVKCPVCELTIYFDLDKER